jgi:SPP1 gp7 family putative phage head morphogenesis protein
MAFGPSSEAHVAQIRLGDLLAHHLAAANLLGRLHIAKVAIKKTKRPVQLATALNHTRNFAEDGSDADGSQSNPDGSLSISFGFDVPNTGAIDYLRNLTPVTRHVFDGLVNEYRNDAFTVAGVSDQNLIAKIRDALSGILAKGGTAADFRKAVDELTTEAGVEKLAAFELDTIFQTNLGKAYSAGRLEQLREPGLMDALPYWQYWTAGDLRVRPAHAALDGFCARAIDPVWLRIYPPNGFNCRCSVIPVMPEDAPNGSDEGGIERLPLMAAFARPPGWNGLRL